MNSCNFIGRLTDDITVKQTNDGKSLANFNLAINRTKEITDFIRCNAWGKNAENLAKYTKKGSQIGISASVNTGSYTKNGKTTYYTDFYVNSFTLIGSSKENEEVTSHKIENNVSKKSQSKDTKVVNKDTEIKTSNSTIDDLVNGLPF